MKKRIIHIVGLQKSGTSLLVRLLENSGHAQFLDGKGKTEGGIDWGNRPSFSPTAWPAGAIYQRSGGANGHQIDSEDATLDICEAVRKQTADSLDACQKPIGISKIPYDMVRIPFVRAVLPDLFIVGIVRRAVPNVFSLWKRFQPNSGTSPPEEGWWGVKPRNWRDLVYGDKIMQIAHQWDQTNQKMWRDRELLDHIVTYDALCSDPNGTVKSILSEATGDAVSVASQYDALPSCDAEYLQGGRLLPRRREWVESNDLRLKESGAKELDPFTIDQIQTVENICKDTAERIGLATEMEQPTR